VSLCPVAPGRPVEAASSKVAVRLSARRDSVDRNEGLEAAVVLAAVTPSELSSGRVLLLFLSPGGGGVDVPRLSLDGEKIEGHQVGNSSETLRLTWPLRLLFPFLSDAVSGTLVDRVKAWGGTTVRDV
jgi:hypothetical protein